MPLEETCLHRLVGQCKECISDLDISHHPNNYDCPDYIKVTIIKQEVIEKIDDYKERY